MKNTRGVCPRRTHQSASTVSAHIVGAAVAALVLTGCAPSADAPAVIPTRPDDGSSTISPDTSIFTAAPSGAIDDDSGEAHGRRLVPVWDEQSRQSAIAAADAAMRAYARPDLKFDAWWAQLQPLLDQKATADYAYMDPSRIVATTVIGTGVLTDETSPYVAYIDVPTNAGTYSVILSRTDATAPWLANRFIVPEGVN